MTLFTSWDTSTEPYTGSGSTVLGAISARRGIRLAPQLRAVLRARLLPVAHARRVERGADDLVADARQVPDAAAADEHHGVLLQVVALAGNVGGDLHAVRQPDARDLPQRGVRLLRRGRVDARADAPLLRCAAPGLRLRLGDGRRTAFPDELIDGGQRKTLLGVTASKGHTKRDA